jgi:protein TonB
MRKKTKTPKPQWTMSLAPRWTVRSLLSGVVVTSCVYLGLPSLERLSHPPQKVQTIRSAQTVELTPPPPPQVKRRSAPKQQVEKNTPKPKLQKVHRRLAPLQMAMDLSVALGDVGGDFSVDFNVSSPELAAQVQDMVFELADLDEKPHPLTRLRPMYPPQAKMRKLEGYVALEFIVGPDGAVRDISILSSVPGEVFVNAARQAVERWRFTPGTRSGKPVYARVRQKVTFSLD